MVSFKTAVKNGFKNAFNYSGRATRAEYWWFLLFMYLMILIPMGVLVGIWNALNIRDETFLIVLLCIIVFAMIIPLLSLQVRRLHDIDRSGWWLLLAFIPYVNSIASFVLLIFYCKRGNLDDNSYGPSPYKIIESETQETLDDKLETTDVKKDHVDKVDVELSLPKESDHRRYMPGYKEEDDKDVEHEIE